jgi:heme/copper-type cytochrome/quinol oxidase subunit 4
MGEATAIETSQKSKRTAAILIVLTVLTSILGMVGLSAGLSIVVVLTIAAVQVGFILFALMHASQEGRILRTLLGLCGFFVVLLIGLMLVAFHDTIDGTQHIAPVAAVTAEEE